MTENQECAVGKGSSLQEMMMKKLDSHMQENETEPVTYTIHKNKLKNELKTWMKHLKT